MSPRKVNKEEKRREIASSCVDLIHEVGMKNLTVAQVARTAGIGKGTIYEYFDNKEDIIFEMINIHIEEHHKNFLQRLLKLNTIKEKVELFFDIILNNNEENEKHLCGYRDFLSTVLAEENFSMKEFNCNKNQFLREELRKILQEGVDCGELKKEVLDLVDGLLTYQKGLIIRYMSQANFDPREDYEKFMNTIFDLLKVKN